MLLHKSKVVLSLKLFEYLKIKEYNFFIFLLDEIDTQTTYIKNSPDYKL